MKSYQILFCVVSIMGAVTATDYCSKEICSPGIKHIACGHKGAFGTSCQSKARLIPMTQKLIDVLVHAHNVKRNITAGGDTPNHMPACRMATMKWDPELSILASFNVKQCQLKHDRCHNTDAFKYSGQNLASKSSSSRIDHAVVLKSLVNNWFSEYKYSKQVYIDSYPSSYSGKPIGHFTVMMADRNIRLGCAFLETVTKMYNYYLACNYATTNMIDFPIYDKCSEAGTKCITGRNDKYPNLCSPSEKYDVNKWY